MSKQAQKIRITLKSYDHVLLDQSAKDICETARRSGADITGPVRMKMRVRKYCVLRSPHIDKKSRDQFEMRVYKRLIDIKSVDNQVMDGLMKLQVPSGVNVELKVQGETL